MSDFLVVFAQNTLENIGLSKNFSIMFSLKSNASSKHFCQKKIELYLAFGSQFSTERKMKN